VFSEQNENCHKTRPNRQPVFVGGFGGSPNIRCSLAGQICWGLVREGSHSSVRGLWVSPKKSKLTRRRILRQTKVEKIKSWKLEKAKLRTVSFEFELQFDFWNLEVFRIPCSVGLKTGK